MSWQTYVDDHLMCEIEGNHLGSAAILGQDGSVWAQSASFPQFNPEDITAMMNDFAEPGSLASTGFYFGGTRYMRIQCEPGAVIRGKKVNFNFGGFHFGNSLGIFFFHYILGPGGVTIKKTTQTLVIGIYDEPMAPDQCNMIVETLGDYLIDHGL